MISPNDFREGLVFEDKGRILQVISYQHHRKSQSKAKVSTKCRDLNTGSVLEMNYPSESKFREIEVRKKDFQYMYSDGTDLHFMDVESYEQYHIAKAIMGDMSKFLIENMSLIGVFLDGVFRTVDLPPNVNCRISFAEPGVRGDTVSNLMKGATTDTGIELKVPLFIKEGDLVKVDTRDGSYVERVKE